MLSHLIGEVEEVAAGRYASVEDVVFACFPDEPVQVVFRGVGDPTISTDVEDAMTAALGAQRGSIERHEPTLSSFCQGFSAQPLAPGEVWKRLQLVAVDVFMGFGADAGVYVSFVFFCELDEEHGVKLTLRSGRDLDLYRVGPADEFC